MSQLFDLINLPFSYVMRFFYGLTDNYMVSLLLFAIVVKAVLFPIGIKTQKNMVKQAMLRPREAAIREKYKGRTDQATQQKMQNEIMALYQSENYNPASGCGPMIIQLIIVWAIYRIVYGPLTYLCGMTAESLGFLREGVASLLGQENFVGNEIQLLRAISEQGIPSVLTSLGSIEGCTGEIISGIEDVLVNHWPNMTVFGGTLDLSQTPTVALNVLLLIPVLNLVTTWLVPKITRKMTYQSPEQTQADMSMKIMNIAMPLMIFWMAFQLPAALGVYWIFQNILGVAQQWILSKMYPYPTFTEEELKEAVRAVTKGDKDKGKSKAISTGSSQNAGGNGKARSLHHIDDDDYPEEPKSASQKNGGKKKPQPKLETPSEEDASAADGSKEAVSDAGDGAGDDGVQSSVIAPAPLKEDQKH
ncbi:MAG: membrane protein insertase YidC [Clostridia bacterium]|nr:membrane protein insertase YidC [Clostridia bacterium]